MVIQALIPLRPNPFHNPVTRQAPTQVDDVYGGAWSCAGQPLEMPAPRKNLLTKASSDRLDRILAAAARRLEQDGIDGLTMRNLAQDSGVSPVTLYNRFGSKDNIISLVVINSFDRNIDLTQRSVDHSTSPFDHLLVLLGLLEHELRDKKGFSQALMVLLFKHDNDRELPNTVYSMLRTRVFSSIRDMHLIGELQGWAPVEPIATEITDRILGTAMKWTQRTLTDKDLLSSLRFSVLTTLHAFMAPRLQKQIDNLLKASPQSAGGDKKRKHSIRT